MLPSLKIKKMLTYLYKTQMISFYEDYFVDANFSREQTFKYFGIIDCNRTSKRTFHSGMAGELSRLPPFLVVLQCRRVAHANHSQTEARVSEFS